MQSPKVTIVVPIYNVEQYLRECLNSIVGQSFHDLEIILIDDGSTDKCGAICEEYLSRDKRIRVIHKSNQGLSSARNAGLDIATGDYISFVDSDDSISRVFIEALLSADAEIAQCGYAIEPSKVSSGLERLSFEYLSGCEMNERLCTDGAASNTVVWNKLWRRKCFENIRFPTGRLHEDEFITWKACWNAKRIARTDVPLYFYRQRSGSIMHSENPAAQIDYFCALKEKRRFFERIGNKKLEALSKAAIVFALREADKDVLCDTGVSEKELLYELKRDYIDLMKSPQLSSTKKASISLHTLCPKAYWAAKSLTGKSKRPQ